MGFINNYSPLRYPGGKAAAANFFVDVLTKNGIGSDGIYCEPFAGGAGVALTLLLSRRVGFIEINDCDPCIAAFWRSILNQPKQFITKLKECKVSIDTWIHHRKIYDAADKLDLRTKDDRLILGFSTFFLNRCNRAGILPKAGPIGGITQDGKYKLDARFKKEVLIERIQKIADLRDRIVFSSHDALIFLAKLPSSGHDPAKVFLYLDPPYYHRGKDLYLNFYTHNDHLNLSNMVKQFSYCKWLMTYDKCDEINAMYKHKNIILNDFSIQYSLQTVKKANEVLIAPRSTKLPTNMGKRGNDGQKIGQ